VHLKLEALKVKGSTFMEFGFIDIVKMMGAVGMFIYGMKLMSESIQRAAGAQFRNTLSNITSNKWIGLLTGFLITGLIQSSSATTVMTVSFVNAGLLGVTESIGLILGANIGTTVTGWLVSLAGFKLVLSEYSVPLFAIGVPLLFVKSGKWQYWGEFIIGFASLFLGLGFMREAVPTLNDPLMLDWLKNFTEYGIWSNLFFVLIGVVITVLVQSSSVAMAITLTMCAQGWMPFEVAASLILGENIGTTSTALISSIIGNREAKITARIHTWFNVIGVVWMIIILPWFLQILASILKIDIDSINENPADIAIGLSAFHTLFNVLNALILINFSSALTRLASLGLQDNYEENDREKIKLNIIGSTKGMPEMTTIQLQKETAKFGDIIVKMAEHFHTIMNTTDTKKHQKLFKRIRQYEEMTDELEIVITEYITNLNKEEVTAQTSLILRNILNICNDLERIADIYYSLTVVLQKKADDNIYFLAEQREKINELSLLILQACKIMSQNLAVSDYSTVQKTEATLVEKKINTLRNEMREEHLSRLGAADYNVKSAMVYNNVFASLERIGDHILNVTEAVVGEV
jgi:phosphate:Na+ symporter